MSQGRSCYDWRCDPLDPHRGVHRMVFLDALMYAALGLGAAFTLQRIIGFFALRRIERDKAEHQLGLDQDLAKLHEAGYAQEHPDDDEDRMPDPYEGDRMAGLRALKPELFKEEDNV